MRAALLWLLLCGSALADPHFEDRSDAVPRHVYSGGWEHFVGGGVAIFDCNADGLPDVFAAGGINPAALFVNKGDWSFSARILPEMVSTTGAYPIDIDADGALDLFVLRVGPNVVLQGDGNCGFRDVTAEWRIPAGDAWSTAFSAWWADERPVMAVGNYVDRDDPDGPFEACDDNDLLIPQGEGWRAEPLSPGYCALSILAAADASGRMRLRLSNDRHYYIREGREQMWDIATRLFLGPEDGWADVSRWGMGIASRDLDGDGRDEVLLTSMGDQLLQIAEDGKYIAAPYEIGTYAQRPHTGGDGRPSTGWHAEFGDVDNDGRADLFIAKGNVDQMPGMATRDPNNLLVQGSDGRFTEHAATAGVASLKRSRGAGLADFDGDGRLDLIVLNRRAPLELYRNVTKDTGHWLRVELHQPGGNREAIGARVEVVTPDGHRQTAQKLIGGGHAGGQALPLHFGLGNAAQAEVRVVWPDGSETRHKVDADRVVTISRP